MPIHQGYGEHNGKRMGWYRWGESGAKYWYSIGNEMSRKRAKTKAEQQRQAAYASGYEG